MATASMEDMRALLDGSRSAFSPDAAFRMPGDNGFEDVMARFTIYEQPTYSASISVRTEGDIQAVVKLATANNIPFLATSGGHGYNKSSGALQGGLQIHLSGMKQIDIDTEANSGDVVTASATENPDLFWGIRGGGAHLGIVNQATYRVADLTNNREAEIFLEALKSLEATKPHDLIVTAYAFYNPIINAVSCLDDQLHVPPPQGHPLTQIQPLLALQPLTSDIKPIQWNHLIRDSVFGLDAIQATKGYATNAGGLNLRNVEIEPLLTITRNLANLAKLFEEHPAARAGSLWLLEWSDSSVVGKTGTAETAYAWRDSIAYMVIAASWPPELPASDPAAVAARAWAAEAREICGAVSGYGERKVFATYADGSRRAEQVFGGNLERLREVKGRWDSGNAFRFAGALGQ